MASVPSDCQSCRLGDLRSGRLRLLGVIFVEKSSDGREGDSVACRAVLFKLPSERGRKPLIHRLNFVVRSPIAVSKVSRRLTLIAGADCGLPLPAVFYSASVVELLVLGLHLPNIPPGGSVKSAVGTQMPAPWPPQQWERPHCKSPAYSSLFGFSRLGNP